MTRFIFTVSNIISGLILFDAFFWNHAVEGFTFSSLPKAATTSTTSNNMCICIDCEKVTNCKAYHFVETKHEQPHINENPTFTPVNGSPTIHVNIRTISNDEDRKKEMERMWREHETETKKAEQKQVTEASDQEPKQLHGENKYNFSPVTTYEYDVVKCESYVQDVGCWVRNMPQEIKDANPNFVPS